MDKDIQCLLLKNDKVLVSRVQEVPSEIGGPDCLMINPYVLSEDGELSEWINFSDNNEVMIRSDDVLTFVEPNRKIIDKYLELTT